MSHIDLIWIWIYLGMVAGVTSVFIMLYAIYHDYNNKDKE